MKQTKCFTVYLRINTILSFYLYSISFFDYENCNIRARNCFHDYCRCLFYNDKILSINSNIIIDYTSMCIMIVLFYDRKLDKCTFVY